MSWNLPGFYSGHFKMKNIPIQFHYRFFYQLYLEKLSFVKKEVQIPFYIMLIDLLFNWAIDWLIDLRGILFDGKNIASQIWLLFSFRIPDVSTPPRKPRVESLKEEPTSPRGGSAPEAEQSFDFDFTVLINIESGHCVFYSAVEKERGKRGLHGASSLADVPNGVSPARRGSDFGRRTNMTPVCTLYIPGVNLEIQYESDGSSGGASRNVSAKASPEKGAGAAVSNNGVKSPPRLNLRNANGLASTSYDSTDGRRPKKKGNLFATCSLESLPAETVLTPQLLDFIEQALEPIPIVNQLLLKAGLPAKEESDSDNAAPASEPWDVEAAVESFPVDIFVLFTMNSTKIRCRWVQWRFLEGRVSLSSKHDSLVFNLIHEYNPSII